MSVRNVPLFATGISGIPAAIGDRRALGVITRIKGQRRSARDGVLRFAYPPTKLCILRTVGQRAPAAAAGRLDREDVAGLNVGLDEGGKLLDLAIRAEQLIAAKSAWIAA